MANIILYSLISRLPGGFSAGTWLGGLLFIVKLNGACLRPRIPRPISRNSGMQLKLLDDSSQLASLNLWLSLEPDLQARPRPLNFHERTGIKLKPEENILQQELIKFEEFCTKNKQVINSSKWFAMLFTRSRTRAFPPEFSIGNTDIMKVKKTHRVLGVLVRDDGNWSAQVQEMVKRATRTKWVLRRMRSLG